MDGCCNFRALVGGGGCRGGDGGGGYLGLWWFRVRVKVGL